MVTDPPYGLKFMGKNWDKAVPAVAVWKECLRVLKPGAFAFILCSPRQDCLSQMIMRLQEAGFKTDFTSLYWTYASGFPKARNIVKVLEKREHGTQSSFVGAYGGFQPKPAVEVIIVAMKPMDKKTFVDQALENGKGVTRMDDCRIPYADDADEAAYDKCSSVDGVYETGLTWGGKKVLGRPKAGARTTDYFGEVGEGKREPWSASDKGRFPANLLVSDGVLDDGKDDKVGKMTPARHNRNKTEYDGYQGNCYGKWNNTDQPVGETYGDSGGFSRFFSLDAWAEKNLPFLIVPKASKTEKDAGLELVEPRVIRGRDPGQDSRSVSFKPRPTPRKNHHPTVKPVLLISYLLTMGSREGDIVLDPFAGSGSTCVAAKLLNRRYIGIEFESEFVEIARKRIEGAGKLKVSLLPDAEPMQANGYRIEREPRPSLEKIEKDDSGVINTLIHGDCYEIIKSVEEDSVDLVLTSPPYADVKSYGQGVAVIHPDNYVDWILPLLNEIHRVLKPTGSFILNINDRIVDRLRHPYVHELIVRAVKETGLKLYDTYTWVKKVGLPTGNNRRLNDWTEHLLHFCREPGLVKWNMDAVREPHNISTIKRCEYPVGGFTLNVDSEGRATGRTRKVIQLNVKGKIPSNVFNFPTAASIKAKIHPAAFHQDLPTWFIKALTDEGDLVMDVFAGSATTCLAAKMLKRNFIGIELNEEYHKMAVKRLEHISQDEQERDEPLKASA